MLNFSYANPTRLVFGRSAEHEVGRVMTSILGRPGKVLVLLAADRPTAPAFWRQWRTVCRSRASP